MMSLEEYVANDAQFCPCCENNTINSEGFNFDTLTQLRADYSCDDCMAQWSEVYTLRNLAITDEGHSGSTNENV